MHASFPGLLNRQEYQPHPSDQARLQSLLLTSLGPALNRRRSDADLPSQRPQYVEQSQGLNPSNNNWSDARQASIDGGHLGSGSNSYNVSPQSSPFHNNRLPLLPEHPPNQGNNSRMGAGMYTFPPDSSALLGPTNYLTAPSVNRRRSDGGNAHRYSRSADYAQADFLSPFGSTPEISRENVGSGRIGHVRRSSTGTGSDGRHSPYISPLHGNVSLPQDDYSTQNRDQQYADALGVPPAYFTGNGIGLSMSADMKREDDAKVARQLVTTGRTAEASRVRRKQAAHFSCPIAGCGSTFTRSFNLKGQHLRLFFSFTLLMIVFRSFALAQ